MNSIERALAILLLMSGGKLVSATTLSERFGVSLRTIYRDIDRLIALGVPVEAARGAEGGYRLAKGYIQPPVALNRNETAALLAALSLFRVMRVMPLASDLEAAERKLIASLPSSVHKLLAQAERIIGTEPVPADIFHSGTKADPTPLWQQALDDFMIGLLESRRVRFQYFNPSRQDVKEHDVEPRGAILDRDLWYLAGRCVDTNEVKVYRADRVRSSEVSGMRFRPDADFTIQDLLGGVWLNRAMRRWEADHRVAEIRITAAQATRLQADWYYRHAVFLPDTETSLVMQVPVTGMTKILPLVRWLGPEAELLGPPELRQELARELKDMSARHA
ncbi:helix-turn-helix transcriptional regulator [Roseibium sediminis]|uniref:helix-turn-helix transcriptional regulator n=1 Tax=Roseibium sediminis TaxID=1775174 RepID=UPI00123CC895|nr:WYL domain-containing protein [Roseibium sediminis]